MPTLSFGEVNRNVLANGHVKFAVVNAAKDVRFCAGEGAEMLEFECAHGSGVAAGFTIARPLCAFIEVARHIGVSATGGIGELTRRIGANFDQFSFCVDERAEASLGDDDFADAPAF